VVFFCGGGGGVDPEKGRENRGLLGERLGAEGAQNDFFYTQKDIRGTKRHDMNGGGVIKRKELGGGLHRRVGTC